MEGEKEVIAALSSHGKREQEKHAREETQKQKESEQELKARRKNYLWIGITIIVLVAFAIGVGYLYLNKPETYTQGEVHWHAFLDITLCGQHKDLPLAEEGDKVHGKNYRGIHLLHTHDDNTIHIEGVVQKKEDIALGLFFDAIGVTFDKDKLFEYKNGDLCPDGKQGMLKMYVNDQPRTDFRDYVPFAVQDARKQIIKLVFESEGMAVTEENQTSVQPDENQTGAQAEENQTTTQSS